MVKFRSVGNHVNRVPLYVNLLVILFINFVFAILDTVTLISSIAGGLIAAVVLLVLYAVKCRRKLPSPGKL